MAFKTFLSRITSSFKIHRSKNPSNIPIQPSPQPLFIEPATPLPFRKPHRSFKHRLSSFLGCGFRTHEGDLPESPPCKWDETPRRDYNSSISSDSDDELFRPPPPPTRHPITTFISGDSDDELFPPPPPPPTPTRHSITTALADTGLCGYESDDEEEEIVTLSLNRKKKMKKLLPPFPAERSKMEGGRSLLERCDKLLHSRAEMMNGTELQPSTVSALDSSFYKDESSSPSPVMKRSIEFKDELGEFEEDMWSPAISPIQSKCEDKSDDCDFVYISEILRASKYLPEDYDIFQWLEKQQYLKGNDTSGVSSLRRKLIYDTVSEILDRDREMSNSSIEKPSLHQIWSEFQRIRERDTAEDLPRKELLGDAISGWRDCPVEMSEATLDIERMIFKDLVGETIGDLVAFAGNRKSRGVVGNSFSDAKSTGKMTSGTELQPSTVSVLDSSFYKDESSSPSPVMKRSIEFKDELGEFDEDIWGPAISPIQSKCEDKSDDCDFVYISEILRASNYLPEDYDIFQWLEKQQYLKGNDTSGVSSLRRKLIYDTVSEILDKDREMSNSSIGKPSLHQIWSEFQRIRERDTAEDLPRKELLGDAISRWRDCPVEMLEVTLDIERMIFKDLVGETIGDLVAFAGNRKSSARWFTDAKGIGKPF
ncbi:Protein LONGIFOLIA 1 [Camellia lanceoleosa]|uniref:Protein LONGIFOLIA 1 n=1 Tax=Camellia lanceoleosa TaxID=1840588 RepID=A0ACC0FNP5_9ERIC|nr:Protein LONGIFOLIA 1 [Camellia lanceoleosa]